ADPDSVYTFCTIGPAHVPGGASDDQHRSHVSFVGHPNAPRQYPSCWFKPQWKCHSSPSRTARFPFGVPSADTRSPV
ncbi:unnamed protein product, partial [Mycena citricolor]